MIPIPPEVQQVLHTLRRAGYAAYPVGGCVRDSLLGVTPPDWDVCTAALPEAVQALFGAGFALPTGLRHGTVTVRSGEMLIEVTTFRVDGAYENHRAPGSVRFTPSLWEDLQRRDFTVNALALDENGEILDACGGQADLRAGLLRCVGDPTARFREDALRILRGLRFLGKLCFQMEAETAAAARALADTLRFLSPERVLKELTGLLLSPGAGEVLCRYGDVLSVVLPGVDCAAGADAVSAAPADFCLRFALLCGENAGVLSEKLRCSGAQQRRIRAFQQALTLPPPENRAALISLLSLLGWEDSALFLQNSPALAALKGLQAEGLPLSVRELAICGDDLQALGAPAGPVIGRCLQTLLNRVQQGFLPNDPTLLREAAQKILRQTVDSFGAVVFRETAAGLSVLMILHRKGWGFPKGHIQPGETPETCARREVWEETGIHAEIHSEFRRSLPSRRPGDTRSVTFFPAVYRSGAVRPQPGETRETRWFPAGQADGLVWFEEDRAAYRELLAYYRDKLT